MFSLQFLKVLLIKFSFHVHKIREFVVLIFIKQSQRDVRTYIFSSQNLRENKNFAEVVPLLNYYWLK
jgi:hypothetical protein